MFRRGFTRGIRVGIEELNSICTNVNLILTEKLQDSKRNIVSFDEIRKRLTDKYI